MTGEGDAVSAALEKRGSDRQTATLVVEYDGADEFITDYTENLSEGGMFICTDKDLAKDDVVELTLSFPSLIEAIRIDGVVRWTRAGDERGVGIEFTGFPGNAREGLAGLIKKITNRDPSVVTRTLKILVVEDNPHVAKLIREGLAGGSRKRFDVDINFDFETAGNGQEALSRLRENSFDALIVDIYMPILDGATLIEKVRGNDAWKALPVIAVSAGGPNAQQSALDAGANFFLDKPMRLRQIIETMQQLLDLA